MAWGLLSPRCSQWCKAARGSLLLYGLLQSLYPCKHLAATTTMPHFSLCFIFFSIYFPACISEDLTISACNHRASNEANTLNQVQQKITGSGDRLTATARAHSGSSAAGATTPCPSCQLHAALPASLLTDAQPQNLLFPRPAASPRPCFPPFRSPPKCTVRIHVMPTYLIYTVSPYLRFDPHGLFLL